MPGIRWSVRISSTSFSFENLDGLVARDGVSTR